VNVAALIAALEYAVRMKPAIGDAKVMFRDERGDPILVEGGIITQLPDNTFEAILAPIKLDRVGGF